MKFALVQPPYPASSTFEAARDCQQWLLDALDSLSPGDADCLLLPEYSFTPGLETRAELEQYLSQTGRAFSQKLVATAQRLACLVVANGPAWSGKRLVNRTWVWSPEGKLLYHYDKTHLTTHEAKDVGLKAGAGPGVFEYEGVRFALAACFDVYFPEYFAALARIGVDVILSPSYQRSESPERLQLISQARALDTGAYFLRAAYAHSPATTGAHSLAAAPDGRLLQDAGEKPGVLVVELDPKAKFIHPASHGQPQVEHRALLQSRQRPETCRLVLQRENPELSAPFPRLCAHRGLSAIMPENTLPAFAAAAALPTVSELEFDLWLSRDGVAVVCHDPGLARTTNGEGLVSHMDWKEIRTLEAGLYMGEEWRGVHVPRLEEVLELVAGRFRLNLHLKSPGPNDRLVHLVCDQLYKFNLLDTAYLAGDADVLEAARLYAPEIERCCLAAQNDPDRQIELALEYECKRVQFMRLVTVEQVRRAHQAGLVCNLFWSDDERDAAGYVARGIDVILTNNAARLGAALPTLRRLRADARRL